jgi:multidrug efflux pump subunit AcrA (membrane-fusion protein)
LTLEQELALLKRELDAAMLAPDFPSVVLTPHLEDTIGARILSGQTYCEVGTLDRLRVEIALPERNWHRVQVGQTVRLKFYTFAERTFEAEVDALSPTASVTDEGERVLVVTTHLDSPPTGLRPGMSGVGKVYLGRRSLLWHITSPFRRFIAMRWWR